MQVIVSENDVTSFVVSCSVAELFICRKLPKIQPSMSQLNTKYLNNRTCYGKSFVPFCSAQDGESTDVNCLAF